MALFLMVGYFFGAKIFFVRGLFFLGLCFFLWGADFIIRRFHKKITYVPARTDISGKWDLMPIRA